MQTLSLVSKKIISLLLVFILAVPSPLLAEGTPASRTQVAVLLSWPADFEDFVTEYEREILLGVALVTCIAGGWIQNKALKDIEAQADIEAQDYTKRINSAKRKIRLLERQVARKEKLLTKANLLSEKIKKSSFESAFNKGRIQGFEEGKASLTPELSKYASTIKQNENELMVVKKELRYLGKANQTKGVEIEYFMDEVALLQKKMEARANVIGVQDNIAKLVIKINTDMAALQTAQGADAVRLSASIKASMAKLSAIKAPNLALKEVLAKFLEETARTLKGKGGVLGVTAAALIGVSLMIISSNSQASAKISNSRLAVARIMDATYKKSPELLFITAQELKEKYGDAVVVDVVYEKQAEYLPVIKLQKALLNDKEIRNSAKNIAKYMGSSAERNKAILLNSFAG